MPSPQSYAMLMRALEEAGQGVLPFMKTLATSPKSEQAIQVLRGMMEVAEPRVATPSPWQRLIGLLPRYEQEGLQLRPHDIRGNQPRQVQFEIRKPGVPGSIGGQLEPIAGEPTRAHLAYMRSSGTRRADIGGSPFMADYEMDIASPAQRELPLRGMKLTHDRTPLDVRHHVPRAPEERQEPYRSTIGITSQDRQKAADTLMRLLRGSGHKKMEFSAEPGERPRYYEKLTGYKAKELTGDPLHRMAERMGITEPRPTAEHSWMNQLTTSHRVSDITVEQSLGMSVDEALDLGLARRAGGGDFMMTEEGLRAVRDWLAGGIS